MSYQEKVKCWGALGRSLEFLFLLCSNPKCVCLYSVCQPLAPTSLLVRCPMGKLRVPGPANTAALRRKPGSHRATTHPIDEHLSHEIRFDRFRLLGSFLALYLICLPATDWVGTAPLPTGSRSLVCAAALTVSSFAKVHWLDGTFSFARVARGLRARTLARAARNGDTGRRGGNGLTGAERATRISL